MLSLFSVHKIRRTRVTALLCLVLLTLSALPLSAIDTAFPFSAEYDRTVSAPGTSAAVSAPSVSAAGAILLNADTWEVYFSRGGDLKLPMASTTKIMTALVAIESLPLDTVVKVDPAAVGTEGSSIYLYEGEALTLEALLYALLLESANDAAVAIAYAVAGGIPEFAEMMNEKAEAIGLQNTHFENPHGLDGETHYTTAYDLARITAEALNSEPFRRIVSTERMTIPQANTDGVRLLLNHNRLLRSYDGCIGVKTGYTKRSGRCLVTAAERDGITLIAVTLSDPNDWKDHTELLDYGFSMYESVALSDSGRISFDLPVFNGISASVTASYETEDGLPLRVTLPVTHGEITRRVELPQYLWGATEKGTAVGRVVYLAGGETVCEVPLCLDSDVKEISYRFGLWERVKGLFVRGSDD